MKTTIELIIKKQLKKDLPKLDLRKVKLDKLGINFIIFWYESREYKYDFYTQWLNFNDEISKHNLRKEYQ